MGLFGKELKNVVEWPDQQAGILLWKWQNNEIKKGSKLIIRPGQQAIFMYNGRIEGIFTEEGSFDIESDIIPFLSTLKSFTFGFNTPMKAEVLFINSTEQTVNWGTKNPINIMAPGLPGGMPIRAFGSFAVKIAESDLFVSKIAGVKQVYTIEDVKTRVMSMLDQLLMSSIAKEGKDMFNLQVYANEIAKGIRDDLDMDLRSMGLSATEFRVNSFSYPESVREMQEKAAGQAMIGDANKYAFIAAADGMKEGGSNLASAAVQMQMGMAMAQQMTGGTAQTGGGAPAAGGGAIPNFCPNCGTATNGMKFCGNCGQKLG